MDCVVCPRRPFSGKYVHVKDDGIYTCVVCENPLFRSEQKFQTMCGWPSFSDVIAHGKVTVKKDTSHGTSGQCSLHVVVSLHDGYFHHTIRNILALRDIVTCMKLCVSCSYGKALQPVHK